MSGNNKGALERFLSDGTGTGGTAPRRAAAEAGRALKKKRQRRELKDGTVPFQGYIAPEGLAELKKLSADEDRPMVDLVKEAIDDLFAKYGRPQVARPKIRE